jgi:hypothetical protein
MPKKIKPMNSVKRGMFPLRKKHTTKTLKKDVASLRKLGYPVKLATHTLTTNTKSLSKKKKKTRGLVTTVTKRNKAKR